MRVQVRWEPLNLSARTAGSEYGENTVRVADLLESMSSNVSEDSRPAVVWMYHPANAEENQDCESKIFQSEQVGIALRMFRTYRVNVTEIRDERIRKEYEDTPAFRFYDPAGEELFELSGRKVDSLSKFDSALDKVWRVSFKTRRDRFSRGMKNVLDELDKLSGQKTIYDQNVARNAERPNPRKTRELEREKEELAETEAEIAKAEQELFESVELREDYLPDEDEVAEK